MATVNEPAKPVFPFVGREKELARLRELHRERRHVLILGADGVGKSALVAHAKQMLPLLVCPRSERLSEICAALESQLGLEATGAHLMARKSRLLRALAGCRQAVVFDGVGWTTPKVGSFFECVSERVPVWIVSRSDHAWDIGRIWPLLSRFERVELHPFHPAETRELMARGVTAGQFAADVLDAVAQLHHLAAGNPRVLCELLEVLAGGRYDLRKRFDVKMLELDHRIRHLPVMAELPPALARVTKAQKTEME